MKYLHGRRATVLVGMGFLERPDEGEHVISDMLSCSHVGQMGGGDRRILESAQAS